MRGLYREGGFMKFWRGSGVIASGSVPAHASYFAIYELAKRSLGLNGENIYPLLFAVTGVSATLAHDIIITPFDVLKQRN